MAELTPMMKQYMEIKEQNKDAILFFRLGDFYEMFFEDAITASRELEITLTGRDCGQEERAPMCGVPYHAADSYISRLILKGYKVAICEQLEDPATAKGIVKRDIIRTVTPGTVIENNMLDEKKNNYIMSVVKKGIFFGLAVCDITTGVFYSTQIKETNNFERLLDEIARFEPAEIIINSDLANCSDEISKIKQRFNSYISYVEDSKFSEEYEELTKSYKIEGSNINIKDILFCIASCNGLLSYLKETQKNSLEHVNKIEIYNINKFMALDLTARRNLEILETMRDRSKKGSLLWVLDKTSTSMGARLLRRWLSNPLLNVEEINKRLNSVKELKENIILRDEIIEGLKKIYDIERLIGKIAYGNTNARDLIALKTSLMQLPGIKETLLNCESQLLKELCGNLDVLEDVALLIDESIIEEPPITIKEGGIIKQNYNEEVDNLKRATVEGKNWIINLEQDEKEKTGIKNLKIGFNKVFGYYIEVTKSYFNLVPDRFIRKQTLANCERFITEELKNLENSILGAQDKLIVLEYNLFLEIRKKISEQIQRIQSSSMIISILDVLVSLSIVASENEYVMPIVDSNDDIEIKEGRHPVIEKLLSSGEFVQNDTTLNIDTDRLLLITGPNMAGKSTYMRQVALITLMAQMGSFVPASYAKIGIVDRIFTRVGASDDLGLGQSTFMVEMMEVATILKEATNKSLIILDEVGRGTSTFDGLSIAWATCEYIANKEKCGAKTLFATHYHELIDLEEKLEGIKNYSVAVKEKGEDVIFLRKIVKGGTDESYGIHVAKLAGVPQPVVSRANEILKKLEKTNLINNHKEEKQDKKQVSGQLDMYNYKLAEVAREIDKINVNELTPMQALNILVKIQEKMK